MTSSSEPKSYSVRALRFLATRGFPLQQRRYLLSGVFRFCLALSSIGPPWPFKKIQNNTTRSFSPFSRLYVHATAEVEALAMAARPRFWGGTGCCPPSAAARLVSAPSKWRRSSVHAGAVSIWGGTNWFSPSRRSQSQRWCRFVRPKAEERGSSVSSLPIEI
jgi:hypothetical protein